jgi:hypothetical protein
MHILHEGKDISFEKIFYKTTSEKSKMTKEKQ